MSKFSTTPTLAEPPIGATLRLRTIRKASEETGSSQSFFKQLLRENKLSRYKINSSTFVSLSEFEKLAASNQEQLTPETTNGKRTKPGT